ALPTSNPSAAPAGRPTSATSECKPRGTDILTREIAPESLWPRRPWNTLSRRPLPMSSTLDQLAVNTIRTLSIDGVQKANSGHPGLPLGAAPMAYVLWTRFLRHNPRNAKWPDRDRFAFSAGHGSMLLYSLLYLTGYDLSLDDLKSFRQWGSKTPGHPEYHLVPGAELTTGPLGQGFANGIGLAMAEAHLAATYNRPGHTIVDHRTFCL